MTPEHAAALAECDRLKARIVELERKLAELEPVKPRPTVADLYPVSPRQ